ncbi:DNA-directed RNA polymerase subunit beta' [Trichinella spiralis]|uniref:DNA-directed RNA polymerase subunit beta n=1 Tax=Trichinella spiralis TaxID=6334 RepID=A0ABR3K7H5_TRISP
MEVTDDKLAQWRRGAATQQWKEDKVGREKESLVLHSLMDVNVTIHTIACQLHFPELHSAKSFTTAALPEHRASIESINLSAQLNRF